MSGIATLGAVSMAFGLTYAIAIANRHLMSPVAARRLPAFAALIGAVMLTCLALLLPHRTAGWAAIEILVFAALLYGLLQLARLVPERRAGIAVALILSAVGTVCTRAVDYVR